MFRCEYLALKSPYTLSESPFGPVMATHSMTLAFTGLLNRLVYGSVG